MQDATRSENERLSTTWKEYISSHWSVLAAYDFFSIDLLVKGRLVRCFVLFAMKLSTRRVKLLGIRWSFLQRPEADPVGVKRGPEGWLVGLDLKWALRP